jgi:hypothetical protein
VAASAVFSASAFAKASLVAASSAFNVSNVEIESSLTSACVSVLGGDWLQPEITASSISKHILCLKI